MEPLLSVRSLTTHFETPEGRVVAVEDLSYDLYPGQTLGMVGESGSGKSVHALSLLKLLPQPQGRIVRGEILYRGRDLLKLPPEEMRKIRGNRISMIFQEPMTSLNPVLTIGEQIAEAAREHLRMSSPQAWEHGVRMLERVGIPNASERAKDFPHQFSGGMRQRTMIAMALACRPDILIADEPTTALDVTIQAQILDLLQKLQKEFRMAVILITHNLGLVAEFADAVVVLYAARCLESASTPEIFSRPSHPYTLGLLHSLPKLHKKEERLDPIPGQPPDLSQELSGCPFHPRCPYVQDLCRRELPELIAAGAVPAPGHFSRCWLQTERLPQALRSEAGERGLSLS